MWGISMGEIWAEVLTAGLVLITSFVSTWYLTGQFKRQTDNLEGRLNSLEKRIESTDGFFSKLKDLVLQMAGRVYPAPINFSAYSPMTLTVRGQDISNELEAPRLVEEYLSNAEDGLPDNANELTIQKHCFKFAKKALLDTVDAKQRARIEKSIYDEGQGDDNILVIFGILFRDAVFRKRGITVPSGQGSQAGTLEIHIPVTKDEKS